MLSVFFPAFSRSFRPIDSAHDTYAISSQAFFRSLSSPSSMSATPFPAFVQLPFLLLPLNFSRSGIFLSLQILVRDVHSEYVLLLVPFSSLWLQLSNSPCLIQKNRHYSLSPWNHPTKQRPTSSKAIESAFFFFFPTFLPTEESVESFFPPLACVQPLSVRPSHRFVSETDPPPVFPFSLLSGRKDHRSPRSV